MGKLTDRLLQQYADGELSPSKAEMVARLLTEQAESQAYVQELSKLGDFVRLMNRESLEEVNFEGFSGGVAHKIRQAEQRGDVWEKIKVAVSEFFDHRRVVWVPSAAVAAALLAAVLLTPLFLGGPKGGPATSALRDDIQLLTSAPTEASRKQLSRIVSVDFGDAKGSSFAVDDDRGGTVGVVWIVEAP